MTQSFEHISLNEVVPKHMDTKISLVSNANIYTRDTFWDLYF